MDEIGMSMKHLQKLKDHENEPRSEYGNLPPELKATQKMMDAMFGGYPVFGALNAGSKSTMSNDKDFAAPQAGQDLGTATPSHEGHAAGPAVAAPDFAPRRIDIETAIMRAPGFDYLLASEIFAALQRRLELRYENLNPQVEEAMQRLSRAFEQAS